MKLQPNILVKQRNLKPVVTKGKYYYNNGNIGRLLRNIKRYSVTERILICAAVSPDEKNGVFLDDKGNEYLISSKDLNSDLEYISSKFVKKKDKKYASTRYSPLMHKKQLEKFLSNPNKMKKYMDWVKGEANSPSIQINEEIGSMYEVGKCYVADDGEWAFKVLSEKDGDLLIQDLTDNRKYHVDVSDLELSHSSEMNEGVSTGISPDVKKITGTLKKKCDNIYYSVGAISDAAKNMKKYGRDYTQPGEPDRAFVDGLIQESINVYNYYLQKVEPRLKDIDMDEYDTQYVKSILSGIDLIRKIKIDKIDLDKLARMF